MTAHTLAVLSHVSADFSRLHLFYFSVKGIVQYLRSDNVISLTKYEDWK